MDMSDKALRGYKVRLTEEAAKRTKLGDGVGLNIILDALDEVDQEIRARRIAAAKVAK